MSQPARLRLILGLFCAGAFAGLTVAVENQATMAVDLAVNASFVPYRSAWMLALFLWVTSMGTGASLVGTALAVSALLWSSRRAALLVPLWVTFLGAQATTWSAKYLIHRVRPVFLPGVATAGSPSFPSAHATATAALVGILALLVACDLPGQGQRRSSITVAVAIVGLIAFSRLFLNVHYLSDVVAGLLVAGFWLQIGSGLLASQPILTIRKPSTIRNAGSAGPSGPSG